MVALADKEIVVGQLRIDHEHGVARFEMEACTVPCTVKLTEPVRPTRRGVTEVMHLWVQIREKGMGPRVLAFDWPPKRVLFLRVTSPRRKGVDLDLLARNDVDGLIVLLGPEREL